MYFVYIILCNKESICICTNCRSQGDFLSFLDTVKVNGGGDECEDVIGGLEVALDENKLHWQSNEHATKVYAMV